MPIKDEIMASKANFASLRSKMMNCSGYFTGPTLPTKYPPWTPAIAIWICSVGISEVNH
jgi:hypothetical protein